MAASATRRPGWCTWISLVLVPGMLGWGAPSTAGPMCPVPGGSLPFGPTRAVAVTGDTAFVGNGALLEVVDVADIHQPAALGRVALDDVLVSIATEPEGERVYAADTRGVSVVDVVDPTRPMTLGRHDVAGEIGHVVWHEGLVFLADRELGLRILDLADPAAPLELGGWESPGVTSHLAVAWPVAYLADLAGGLRVLDVSAPGAPVEIGSWSPGDDPYVTRVALAGDIVCVIVSDGSGGSLRTLDVSDPGAPLELGRFPIVDAPDGLVTSGDLALVSEPYFGGVHVIDVSDPSEPTEIALIGIPDDISSLSASADRLLVGRRDIGAGVYGLGGADGWTRGGTIETAGETHDVAVSGGLVYAAGGGLRILDAAPGGVVEIGAWELDVSTDPPIVAGPYATEIEVEDGLASLLWFQRDLWIVDVTDPTAPFTVSQTPTHGLDLARVGHHLLIPDHVVRVIDISDAHAPRVLDPVELHGADRIAVVGDRALVPATSTSNEQVLTVLDVSDPATPVVEATVPLPCQPRDLAASGDIVYVGCPAGSLAALDLSDLGAPSLVGTLDDVVAPRRLELSGGCLYVLEGWYDGPSWTLRIVDVRDPARMSTVAVVPTRDRALGLAVGPGLLAVGDGSHGVSVLDPDHCPCRAIDRSTAVE